MGHDAARTPLGRWLADQFRKASVRAYEVAWEMGRSQPWISFRMTGRARWTEDDLWRLAEYLSPRVKRPAHRLYAQMLDLDRAA